MKKAIKRLGCVCLAGLMTTTAAATLASCGGEGKKGNMTVFNIKIFNGGFGYAWLEEVANEFMEIFKDTEFETGKKGVDIKITPNKQFTDIALNIQSGADKEDLYYTETSDLSPFLNTGVAYDLTSVMTAKVYDENGNVKLNAAGDGWETQTVALADRFSEEYYADAYNLGTEEQPSYFSFPYEDSVSGIIVDWDLISGKDTGTAYNIYEGIDGMPATFDDFYDMLYNLQQDGYYGFIYSTAVGYYTPPIQSAIMAKVNGYDFYRDFNSDGYAEYDFDGDGTISDSEKITPQTQEMLLDTKGYQAAVEMAHEMFRKEEGNTYYDPAVTQGVSFGGAQIDFVMSKSSKTRRRIAMILEGDWWENETRATFNSMGSLNEEDGYGKREFRMMPIPSYSEDDKNEKYTIGGFSGGDVVVVNQKTVGNNPAKQKIAELFLQFQYAVKGLKTFTRYTGSKLPFQYSLTDEELAQLTPFAQNMWKLRHDDRVDIVRSNPVMRTDQMRLASVVLGYNAKIGGTEYLGGLFNNFVTFRQSGKDVTVAQYIEGAHTYYDGIFTNAVPDV